MAVGREQVEPAVEVVVEEEEAELERRLRRSAQTVEVGQVGELEARRLVGDVEGGHLVGEVADGQPQSFVVEEAGPVAAHAPARRARLVERDAREDRDLLELPLAHVVEEEVLHRVVGHGDIHQAVAIDVERGDAQRLAQGNLEVGRSDLDAGLLADVGEPPAVVAQQAAERARERGGRAVRPAQSGELEALDLVDLGGPGDVVADEQIEIAVVLDVKERRAGEPAVGALGVGRVGRRLRSVPCRRCGRGSPGRWP